MSYQFATFLEAYPNEVQTKRRLRISREIRYKVLCLKHKQYIHKLVEFINQDDDLIAYVKSHREVPISLLKHYTSKGNSADSRLQAMMADFTFAKQHLSRINTDCELVLANIQEKFTVKLKMNNLNCMEGLLQIAVYEEEKRLYIASFSLGYRNFLIGSIQGANDDDAKKTLKTATKAMFGLRPQQLMVWLLLELANMLHFHKVEAISINNHPLMKHRYKMKNKKLFIADYDQIWSSYQGKLLANGNWSVPTMMFKSLDEIASKKRSMYRKRYLMLDNIRESMSKALQINLET